LSAKDLGIAPAFSLDIIAPRILSFRDQRVILDADLAALYEIPTKRFNEAVKRNLGKFPHDFMFQVTTEEFDALRSLYTLFAPSFIYAHKLSHISISLGDLPISKSKPSVSTWLTTPLAAIRAFKSKNFLMRSTNSPTGPKQSLNLLSRCYQQLLSGPSASSFLNCRQNLKQKQLEGAGAMAKWLKFIASPNQQSG
jgi:ORF6N domain